MNGQPFDDYNLTVNCIQGLIFSRNVTLTMRTGNVSVLVQTDKAIYKPSDTVRFRVLILNENLKPLEETTKANTEIYITDGAQNRVKQFRDLVFIKGVFEGNLSLSDSPILGSWHVNVQIFDKKETEKMFEVAEYTLPTFHFRLDVNPHVNYGEQKISTTVVAKHTFGKMAKGNVTVTAEVESKMVSKSMEVIGEKLFEFHIENDLGIIENDHDRTIRLYATFIEEISGKVQNASASVQVHVLPYRLTIKKKLKKFKPGLPFTVEAIVQYYGKNFPVTDNTSPVKFTVEYRERRVCNRTKHTKGSGKNLSDVSFQRICFEGKFKRIFEVHPSNGISRVDISVPDNIFFLNITAEYLQTKKSEFEIQRAPSEDNHYISIASKTEM